MIESFDDSARLIATVKRAVSQSRKLAVVGHDSKYFYDFDVKGDVLCTADHQGIEDYRPNELVVTVRAGTSLRDLKRELARHGQMLGADPPEFGGQGTVGGAIACGLSGPGRPWSGSLRDSILGIEILNGLGERLRFGGRVVKNVAGYDVARLMVGSRGTLGVILSASFKVVPQPQNSVTLTSHMSYDDVVAMTRRWSRTTLPLSATCYLDGEFSIRLSGQDQTLNPQLDEFKEFAVSSSNLWAQLRDHTHDFFQIEQPLWRMSNPIGRQVSISIADGALFEWNGSQVWVKGAKPEPINGGVVAFRHAPTTRTRTTKYHERIKNAFDPLRVLNSGIIL